MYTLLIDTHFSEVLLLLYKDGKIVYKIKEESKQSHSILTMPLLKKMLNEKNVNIKEINQLVVVNGPGSFTGVRIGVTIAKTISYCLNIPIKVISSLEVVASNIECVGDKIVAINDRNGYFIGKFSNDNVLKEEYFYLNNKEFVEFSIKNTVYIGNFAIDYEKVYGLINSKKTINPHLVNPLYVKKIEVQK